MTGKGSGTLFFLRNCSGESESSSDSLFRKVTPKDSGIPYGFPHPLSWTAASEPMYLEFPDALALLCNFAHSFPHQRNKHVEQEDVGKDDIKNQKADKHRLELVVLCELQVPHADSELEKLQAGVIEAVVGRAASLHVAAPGIFRAVCVLPLVVLFN